jgi:hypothetical protein
MIMLAGSYWVFFYEQSSGASIAQTRTAVVNMVVAVASALPFVPKPPPRRRKSSAH